MSAAVVSTSVIGSAAITIHCGRGSAAASRRIWSRNVRALAKNSGASKRKITSPGSCSASGCSSAVVLSGHPRDAAERGLVGPPGAAEDVEDRERDRDRDALQHAEQRDAEERGDRQQELDAALAPQPHGPGHVGQRQRGGDHDRGERRVGEVLQQPGHEHEHQHDRRGSDDPGELRLGAGLLGDGRARPARADRESLEEPGGDVRGADPDHLAVAVDLLAGARGERRGGGDRVGERDQRDPERAGDQQREVGDRAWAP